jgi:PAS domain S-box-containing protein
LQAARAQGNYKWLAINDTVQNDEQLVLLLRKRVREVISDKTKETTDEISKEINIAEGMGDTLETAFGLFLQGAISDYEGDYEQTIKRHKQALSWIKQTKHNRFIATIYSQTAYAMNRLSLYDSALVNYNKALALRKKINDVKGIINTKNFIGLVYQRTGAYEQAFQNYTDALNLISDSISIQLKAFTYINISSIFIKTANFKLAEKYLLEALKIRNKSHNELLIAHAYLKLARLYYEKGEIDASIEYGLNAVAVFDKKNWQKPLPSIYNLMGLCYLSKKEYSEANDFFQSSRKIAISESNRLEFVQNSINLGKLYYLTNKYKTAIKYLKIAIEQGERIGLKNEVINAYAILADVYYNSKQYKKAFLAKKREEKLRKEVFNTGFAEKIAAFISSKEVEKANLIFELQQKEWENKNNARIQKEKLYRNIYFVSFFIFLVFIFIIYRGFRTKIKSNNKLKKSNKLIAQKQEEILNQKNTLEHQKNELTITLNRLRKLTKAIEQSSSIVVITDLKGNIEYVNPKFTETTGYTFEEAVGNNSNFLKSGNKPESFYREMWETLLNGKEWHGEFENIRKNGEVYFEHASIASVIDENGKITNFIAVKEDITKQRKILTELEGLNAIQTKIFSVIGHDLRSPLGSVKTLLEILSHKNYVVKNVELSEIIDAILKSIISVNLLSDNLLNWAKSWQGSGSEKPALFNVREIINENIVLLTNIAHQKNIQINTNLNSSYNAYADPNMISTVIRNLIANAIKFTQPNGEIIVSTSNFDNKIKIAVQDSGIGIKKELIPILLDEYDLYTTPGTEQEKGSGLGLSICLQFIKINNGELSIESTEGKGSIFSFTLPTEES